MFKKMFILLVYIFCIFCFAKLNAIDTHIKSIDTEISIVETKKKKCLERLLKILNIETETHDINSMFNGLSIKGKKIYLEYFSLKGRLEELLELRYYACMNDISQK